MEPRKKRSFFLLKAEQGASAVEYALLLASMSLAIYAGTAVFGQGVANLYSGSVQQFQGLPGTGAPPASGAGDLAGGGGGGSGSGEPSDTGKDSRGYDFGNAGNAKDGAT